MVYNTITVPPPPLQLYIYRFTDYRHEMVQIPSANIVRQEHGNKDRVSYTFRVKGLGGWLKVPLQSNLK